MAAVNDWMISGAGTGRAIGEIKRNGCLLTGEKEAGGKGKQNDC